MTDHGEMTHEEYDEILCELMDEEKKPCRLLAIPGVYEEVSEYYNNSILEVWERRTDEKD